MRVFLLSIVLLALGSQAFGQAEPPPTTQTELEKAREQLDLSRKWRATLPAEVHVFKSVMDPKNVSDTFGKRIAERFLVMQATIQNQHQELEFLIHDISLDVSAIKKQENPTRAESDLDLLTSRELSVLRGVAERGRINSGRNIGLRILRSAGSILASVVTLGSFGPAFAPGVALFNGPMTDGYALVFPDFGIGQFGRINDSAYAANSVVPVNQSKVVTVFFPLRLLLNETQRKLFWEEPLTQVGRLEQIKILVHGSLIQEVARLPPLETSVIISGDEAQQFETRTPEVDGLILGRYLSGATLSVTDGPDTVTVETGAVEEGRIAFTLKSSEPIPPGTTLTLGIVKGGRVSTLPYTTRYLPQTPTVTGVQADQAVQLRTAGQAVDVVVSGTALNLVSEVQAPAGVQAEITNAAADSLTLRVTATQAVTASPLVLTLRTVNERSARVEVAIPDPPAQPDDTAAGQPPPSP